MSPFDPPAPDLGAIRARLMAYPRVTMYDDDVQTFVAAYDAQAARLAEAQTAGDPDPALYHDMESLRRRAPFAYGQWRADLAFLLETVDAQAARLAAAERFHDLGAHTAACQAGLGYGGCEATCAHLRAVIAGAVEAGEARDGE